MCPISNGSPTLIFFIPSRRNSAETTNCDLLAQRHFAYPTSGMNPSFHTNIWRIIKKFCPELCIISHSFIAQNTHSQNSFILPKYLFYFGSYDPRNGITQNLKIFCACLHLAITMSFFHRYTHNQVSILRKYLSLSYAFKIRAISHKISKLQQLILSQHNTQWLPWNTIISWQVFWNIWKIFNQSYCNILQYRTPKYRSSSNQFSFHRYVQYFINCDLQNSVTQN